MTSMVTRSAEHPGAFARPATQETADLGRIYRPAVRSVCLDEFGLLTIARRLACNVHVLWPEMIRPQRRIWDLMVASEDFEAWVVAWPPGGAIELHDHGNAAGAVVVASGELVETAVREGTHGAAGTDITILPAGGSTTFGARHVHDVVNLGAVPAISVHVYAPRLKAMTFYEIVDGRLEPVPRQERS